MKKKVLTLFVALALALSATAQEQGFYGNKFFDNWYIGLNGGVGTVTVNQSLLSNLNPNVGMKVGKMFSPYLSLGVECNAYFSNKFHSMDMTTKTAIKYHQLGVFMDFNIMNAFWGYYGEPRVFEILAMTSFNWGHNYGNHTEGTKPNLLVHKLGLDFNFNLGKKKAWSIYLEPSINYCIAGARDEEIVNGVGNKIVIYDIKSSFLQLNVGVNYRFLTSNGTHNFATVEACNQMEIEELNAQVNQLREKAKANDETILTLQREQDNLNENLNVCENKAPQVKELVKEPDLPAVFYQVNKSIITPAQQPSVAIAAEVMKNHPEYDLHIKGYASPEGPHANNTSLGIRRANAVKTMLIDKYKIDATRIKAEGCGETDELFPIYEFNRVAVMLLEKKEK